MVRLVVLGRFRDRQRRRKHVGCRRSGGSRWRPTGGWGPMASFAVGRHGDSDGWDCCRSKTGGTIATCTSVLASADASPGHLRTRSIRGGAAATESSAASPMRVKSGGDRNSGVGGDRRGCGGEGNGLGTHTCTTRSTYGGPDQGSGGHAIFASLVGWHNTHCASEAQPRYERRIWRPKLSIFGPKQRRDNGLR